MLTIAKLDLAKAYPEYYRATQKPQLVNFEPYHYLTCQGQCAPEDAYFLGAIEVMYPLAYGIKFLCKKQELDFVIPKMEAFWWVEGDLPYDETPREEWHWKILFQKLKKPQLNENQLHQLKENQLRPKSHHNQNVINVMYLVSFYGLF